MKTDYKQEALQIKQDMSTMSVCGNPSQSTLVRYWKDKMEYLRKMDSEFSEGELQREVANLVPEKYRENPNSLLN